MTSTTKKSSKEKSEDKYDKKHPKDYHKEKDNAVVRFFKHLYKKR